MLLSAEHLSMDFGDRKLLEDVNFYLDDGDKTGIIGINGTGKSTFLKILAGELTPDAGKDTRNPNVQVSFLSQNPAMEDGATVLEQVFLHFPAQFRELNEYEAKSMLNKLGITDYNQKIGTLSGGQRKRVALAAALIHPADVLVLDEPTNHLDAEMTAWLEDRLRKFRGGLIMVTHDRYFLERVVNHITELSRGKLYHYEANYSKYLELKAQRAEMEQASERKRQSILRVEREWIMRGCRARSTKSKERIARYEALLDKDAPQQEETVRMGAAASRLGKQLIELEGVSKAFGEKQIIVFMPTWRGVIGNVTSEMQNEILQTYFDEWDAKLQENQILYVKLHPLSRGGSALSCHALSHFRMAVGGQLQLIKICGGGGNYGGCRCHWRIQIRKASFFRFLLRCAGQRLFQLGGESFLIC